MIFVEPVTIIGEGEYNLDSLIEIKVKDSFFNLDQDIIGCQNDEELTNCTTRHYIDTLINECGCLPFNIRLNDQVIYLLSIITSSILMIGCVIPSVSP